MTKTVTPEHSFEELLETLERTIEQRTCRRVHQLRVDSRDEGIVVQGVTASYYVKQLVLAAVEEVTDVSKVQVEIRVG